MSEEIYVDIMKKDWSVKIEAEGFHGKSCVEVLDQIQEAMNGKTVKETLKPSYFEEENNARIRESERS